MITDEQREALAREIVTVARKYAGTGAHHEPDRYLELLMGPSDDDRKGFLEASSCALYVRGVMRIAGVDHPILQAKYRNTRAVSDVLEIATSKGAFVSAWESTGTHPRAGDVCWIKTPGKNDDHMEIITEVRGPWLFETVAGGQGDHGTESGTFHREWDTDGQRLLMGKRTVVGWIDARRLADPTRFPATIPNVPVAAQASSPAPIVARPSSSAVPIAIGLGVIAFAVFAAMAKSSRGAT